MHLYVKYFFWIRRRQGKCLDNLKSPEVSWMEEESYLHDDTWSTMDWNNVASEKEKDTLVTNMIIAFYNTHS